LIPSASRRLAPERSSPHSQAGGDSPADATRTRRLGPCQGSGGSPASDATVTFKFGYDNRNRTTKVRDDTQQLEIEYEFDEDGNLIVIEDTSDNEINYYYPISNQVLSAGHGTVT
jgi:YD repeat-containing protein